MAVALSLRPAQIPPHKRLRRSATTVLAGDFDIRPTRDVLTSLLNGVAPYKVVEKDEETRRTRRREKKEREREKKRAKAAAKERDKTEDDLGEVATQDTAKPVAPPVQHNSSSTSSFWRARPAIHIATMQRSVSVTPPPMPSSPASTPGPSNSSSTSHASSKRPYTPNDDEDIHQELIATPPPPQPRKKRRVAVRKGWKGWVEGSPPPSEKLINLDAVPVLQERRTRSGKNFDAIGVGKDGWV